MVCIDWPVVSAVMVCIDWPVHTDVCCIHLSTLACTE